MPLGQHNTIIHNICLCCGADRKKKGISIYFREKVGGKEIAYIKLRRTKNMTKIKF